MLRIVNYIILFSSVLLIALILIQSKGAGLSTVFGGEGNAQQTRRGFERSMFTLTVAVAVIFVGACLAAIFLHN